MTFVRECRGRSLRFLKSACEQNQHVFRNLSLTFEMGHWCDRS
jgi:hypothetical protein